MNGTEGAAPRALVALDAVGKTFANGTVALERFSLAVNEGEFVSLLGPSGCGKSTVLRLMAGLAAPSAGRVGWPGLVRAGAGLARDEVGFVFQDPTLLPWRDVFSNVHLPLRLRGIGRKAARDRVMAGLESVGLSEFAGAYPRELSGGMKMRVSLARALITRPRLLLMDEPFAALDEITRHRLNEEALELVAKSGTTVVFVTHSVFEAAYLSGRVVVMTPRPGRIFSEVDIDRPAGRGADHRNSAAYHAACRALSEALAAAMDGEGAS